MAEILSKNTPAPSANTEEIVRVWTEEVLSTLPLDGSSADLIGDVQVVAPRQIDLQIDEIHRLNH